MFKNIFYKAIALVVITMTTCSCNKYLELRPQNGITSDNFWQSKEQLQAAVIGVYNRILTGSGGKSPAEVFFVWGEVRADFVAPGPGIGTDEQNIINANILPTTSNTSVLAWQPIYSVINLCNNVIQFGPGVLTKDNTLTQAQLNAYLGEMYGLRALMYFYLVRTYGDVVLKLTATATDQDLAQLPKTPQKDVLTQIVADLKLAETLTIPTYSDNASDKGRINTFTINAMEADVYLWMDDYADCITACDKILNSGKYGLVNGDSNWFSNLYVTGNSSESIFELQFDSQSLNPYFNMFAPGVSKRRYLADPNVIDNFYTTDPLGVLQDIRGIDVAVHNADQSIYKYIAYGPTSLRTVDVSYAHWIMYRLADVMLMKAEACIYSSRGQDALDIINVIRTRAKALPSSAQSPSNTDVGGMTTYLVAERAREFAYEGKRWYDLLRNAKRNSYARLDLLQTAALESVTPLYQQSALAKLHDPNYLYFPIPKYDIQNDPNLIQNPFYK
jgi:hypothetical protein